MIHVGNMRFWILVLIILNTHVWLCDIQREILHLSRIFNKEIGFGIFMPYTLGTDQTIGLAKLQKFGLVRLVELTKV